MRVDLTDMRWHLRWVIGCQPTLELLHVGWERLPRRLTEEQLQAIAEYLTEWARSEGLTYHVGFFINEISKDQVKKAYQQFRELVEKHND